MKLLTKKEAAERLTVSLRTFDKWRSTYPSELAATVIGGTVPRWTDEQIDRFIALFSEQGWSSKGGHRTGKVA
jgi:transposase